MNVKEEQPVCVKPNKTFRDTFLMLQDTFGTRSELWVDVAEWLVRNGARRLVVLCDADYNEAWGTSLRRVNKLIDVSHCTLAFLPLSRVKTHDDALNFFKDMCWMGAVLSIFCVSMDENGDEMKSLDSASRELVPDLPQFVSLLGTGWAVSEGRAASGLPVCSLRSDSSIHSLSQVLPHLSDILADEHSTARFFNIGYSTTDTNRSENQDYHYKSYLPATLEEVEDLDGGDLMFQEVTTRSPRLRHVRHTMLPVFLVSGLGMQDIQPLLHQLAYPAFVATLPTTSQHSVEEYAELLMLEIRKIQAKGPYNIIGLSWGGAAALELGGLLESRGHRVELMLLEGAPASLGGRIQALCDHHQADLPTSLLACVFQLSSKVVGSLGRLSSWDEMLSSCLTVLPEEKRGKVFQGVSALHAQLTALQCYQPCSERVCSNLTLFTSKPLSQSDTSLLSQHCKLSPKIVVTGSDTLKQLISDDSTASIINENLAFDVNI